MPTTAMLTGKMRPSCERLIVSKKVKTNSAMIPRVKAICGHMDWVRVAADLPSTSILVPDLRCEYMLKPTDRTMMAAMISTMGLVKKFQPENCSAW